MAIEPIKGFYVHDEVTDTDGVAKYGADSLANLDETVSLVGYAPDAKAVGDRLTATEETANHADELAETLNEGGLELKDDVITGQVDTWLDEHPEATTTVLDGAITEPKINSNFLKKIKNDYVTPQMFGAIGDGTTDDTQAVNDAIIDAQTNNKILYFPNGTYFVTTQIVIVPTNDVIMNGSIKYLGNGIALTIGNATTALDKKKYCINVTGNNDYISGTVGVELINIYTSEVVIKNVTGFETGVRLTGDTKGFVYNRVFIYNIMDCLQSLVLYSANNGWVNDNQYFGGRMYVTSGKSFKSSSTGILLTSNTQYSCNNNTFFCPNVEGLGTGVKIEYGSYNDFINVRTEGTTTPFNCPTSNKCLYNNFVVGFGSDGTVGSISSLTTARERTYSHCDKLIFDSGYIPSHSASNANYCSCAKMLNYANDGTLTTERYRITATKDYLELGSTGARHIGAVLLVGGGDVLKIRPVVAEDTTHRMIVVQWDSEGNIINEAPFGGSTSYQTISSVPGAYLEGANGIGLRVIKLSDQCRKVYVGVLASGAVVKLQRLVIYSNQYGTPYTMGNEDNPMLSAIPTSDGFIGQFVKSATPTATVKGWIYNGTEWLVV